MAFFLNPKNLAIIILAAAIAAVSGLYLWQRGTLKDKEITITRQTADITALNKTNADLQGQVSDYKKAIAVARKTQQEQQQIANNTVELQTQIVEVKTKCTVEAQDEKTLSDITYFFNSRGLRSPSDSNTKTGREILPEASSAGAGRSWTIKQLVTNYLVIIDYALQLERTVDCYESN